MAFPSTVELGFGREKLTTIGKKRPLGTRGTTPDGRVFYYSQAGAATLIPNILVQAKVGLVAHNVALTPSTAIGDWVATAGNIPLNSVSIGVVWVTSKSAKEYDDGYMTVETTPGGGMYRVDSDPDAGNSATATIVRLHPDDSIKVAALTTVSKLAFTPNPYTSVVIAPLSTLTGAIVGVTPVNVTAAYYFWLQTAGIAAVEYSALVAAVVGHKVIGGFSATAGKAAGVPVYTGTIAQTVTVTAVGNVASRPTIGYALEGIPDAGDLLKVMLTIRN